jgi:hypothetical protein
MTLKIVFSLAFLISSSFAHEFSLHNNCPFTVWPGILGKEIPENGGFELAHGATKKMNVGNHWSGRIWGRTQCEASGHCVTGDCGKITVGINL